MSPKPNKGSCGWCPEKATHRVVLAEGRQVTKSKQKVWQAEQTMGACETHAHQWELRGKEVREA